MKNKFMLGFVLLLMLPLVSASAEWWDFDWSYRQSFNINTSTVARTDWPIEHQVNFTALIQEANASSPFDINSPRLIEYDSSGTQLHEMPIQFDMDDTYNETWNALGTLSLLLNGTTSAQTIRYFELYFDTTDDIKDAVTYPSSLFASSNDSMLFVNNTIAGTTLTWLFDTNRGDNTSGLFRSYDSNGNDLYAIPTNEERTLEYIQYANGSHNFSFFFDDNFTVKFQGPIRWVIEQEGNETIFGDPGTTAEGYMRKTYTFYENNQWFLIEQNYTNNANYSIQRNSTVAGALRFDNTRANLTTFETADSDEPGSYFWVSAESFNAHLGMVNLNHSGNFSAQQKNLTDGVTGIELNMTPLAPGQSISDLAALHFNSPSDINGLGTVAQIQALRNSHLTPVVVNKSFAVSSGVFITVGIDLTLFNRGDSITVTANVTDKGNQASTINLTFITNLGNITRTMYDDGTNGDPTPTDNQYTAEYNFTPADATGLWQVASQVYNGSQDLLDEAYTSFNVSNDYNLNTTLINSEGPPNYEVNLSFDLQNIRLDENVTQAYFNCSWNGTRLTNITDFNNGTYRLYFFASSDYGNHTIDCAINKTGNNVSYQGNITVRDFSAPSYSTLTENPANNSVFQDGQKYTFSSIWTDNFQVEFAVLQFDGINYTNNSPSGSTYAITLTNLSVAEHNYTWYAQDDAGNNNITISQNYTIRNTEPNYSSSSQTPSSPATYAQNQGYQFNIIWEDNDNVHEVIFEFDGVNYTNLTRAGTQFSTSVSDLAVGNYSFRWYANDTDGATNQTDQETFTVEKSASLVAVSIDNLSVDTTAEYNIPVNITGTLTLGETNITIFNNGTPMNTGPSPISNITTFLALDDFNISVEHPATQNFTRSFQSYIVSVQDQTAPVVTLIGPVNMTNQSHGNRTYYFNFTDNFFSNGSCLLIASKLQQKTNTSMPVDQTISLTSTNLTEGNSTWNISCTDDFGNIGYSESRIVVIDQSPPSITIEPSLQNLTVGNNISLNATILDIFTDIQNAYIEIVQNGTLELNVTLPTTWTYLWNTSAHPNALYNITFFANDTLNNSANATISVIVDRSIPVIDIYAPVHLRQFSSDFNLNISFASEGLNRTSYNITNSSGSQVLGSKKDNISLTADNFTDLIDVNSLYYDTFRLNASSLGAGGQRRSVAVNFIIRKNETSYSENRTSPVSPVTWSTQHNVSFLIKVADNTGIQEAIFELNGVNHSNTTTNDNFSMANNFTIFSVLNLSIGKSEYRWHFVDYDGHLNSTPANNITVVEPEFVPFSAGGTGSASSSGGGAGGGCIENWTCSQWESCQNGIQYRQCVEHNKCGTEDRKPPELQECLNQIEYDVQIIRADDRILPGDDLDFSFFLKNMGLEPGDINITYELVKGTTVVSQGSEVVYFDNLEERSYARNIPVPLGAVGAHTLIIKVQRRDYLTKATRTIIVGSDAPISLDLFVLLKDAIFAKDATTTIPLQVHTNKDYPLEIDIDSHVLQADRKVWEKNRKFIVNKSAIFEETMNLPPGQYALSTTVSYQEATTSIFQNFEVGGGPSLLSPRVIKTLGYILWILIAVAILTGFYFVYKKKDLAIQVLKQSKNKIVEKISAQKVEKELEHAKQNLKKQPEEPQSEMHKMIEDVQELVHQKHPDGQDKETIKEILTELHTLETEHPGKHSAHAIEMMDEIMEILAKHDPQIFKALHQTKKKI